MNISRIQSGFTLIELAMVLFILGLLLGGILGPLSTSIEQEQRAELEHDYNEINDALIGYVIANGRFPCPDCPTTGAPAACNNAPNVSDDGVEDRVGALCAIGSSTVVEGNLPWVTLGVMGTDPWGNVLKYAVESDYADTTDGDGCTPVTAGVSFSLCSTATIIVQDEGDACPSATPLPIATGIPALVYSPGNSVPISCYENENTDGDAVFVYKDYSEDLDFYYNDMLLWISPHILNSKMVKAEVLP